MNAEKLNNLSFEVGRMLFFCYEHVIHAEMYDSTKNIFLDLKDILDEEYVTEGIMDAWDNFTYHSITNQDIINILEQFN